MKLRLIQKLIALGTVVVILPVATLVAAEANPQSSAAAKTGTKISDYTGTIGAVDPEERTIKIKKVVASKTFNLAQECTFTTGMEKKATLDDMRADMEVVVSYQTVDGILVATHIAQQTHTNTGYIKAVVPASREIIMEKMGFARKFKVTDSTKLLSHNKEVFFHELKAGQKVTLTYTKQDTLSVAHKIENTAETLSGTVEAIDASANTVRVKSMLTTHKFNLGEGCKIVLDGNTEGKMRDLRIGEKVTIDYEELKGVFVASRIELGGEERHTNGEALVR